MKTDEDDMKADSNCNSRSSSLRDFDGLAKVSTRDGKSTADNEFTRFFMFGDIPFIGFFLESNTSSCSTINGRNSSPERFFSKGSASKPKVIRDHAS